MYRMGWDLVVMRNALGSFVFAPKTATPSSFCEVQIRWHEAVDFYMMKNVEWFSETLRASK